MLFEMFVILNFTVRASVPPSASAILSSGARSLSLKIQTRSGLKDSDLYPWRVLPTFQKRMLCGERWLIQCKLQHKLQPVGYARAICFEFACSFYGLRCFHCSARCGFSSTVPKVKTS